MTGRAVLVVDDNAENRALAEATLEDEGYRVVLANDGEQAVAAFTRESPECILMDIRMPVLDGIGACERIRALPGGEAVAIIFLTAQRDVETFDRALAAGGDDFITKPFRPSELVVRVQTALRLRRIAAERSELFAQIKQQRDQLQRLQLQKEQFAAFLVHDLKNPVNSIELQAQIVARDATAAERTKRAAGSIQQETRALLRMITNLLDIAKADEGRLAPTRQGVDAEKLIRTVFDELAPRAASAEVTLETDASGTELMVDPDLMHRVVANLVENAIRHAPDGTAIKVSATRADGHIELRIADAGPGVPAEARDKIFERFESGSTGRLNRGLGLAFCKIAIEAHGGRIWVEDGSPGAVFVMRFPDAH
ncbi:MAG TPA: response regulator [Kofleriaceae bacterium]|nr:response regulator [Kofleriaceae bacterium]